jgi:hypothetical protein
MLLSIAIISLIGFILGMIHDFFNEEVRQPSPRLTISAISVISWWNICNPLAIILIILGGIWLLICFWVFRDR